MMYRKIPVSEDEYYRIKESLPVYLYSFNRDETPEHTEWSFGFKDVDFPFMGFDCDTRNISDDKVSILEHYNYQHWLCVPLIAQQEE